MSQDPARACLDALEELYVELEAQLPKGDGNPCGRCRECCTGRGLNAHNVTRLELDYIGDRVGTDGLVPFTHFLRRDGAVEVCPYFDDTAWGCGIYAHRPFSCRIFGHHRAEGTSLPAVCVFRGQEKIFGAADYYQAVPLAAQLRDLVRRYWPYRQDHFEAALEPPASFVPFPTAPTAADALDRALHLMSQGRLQEALDEFEASDLPSTPYVLYCLSLVFEGLQRHADSITALTVALEQVPNCVPLWFRLACNRFSDGDHQGAEQAFLETVRLSPDHALAHGFLGGHYAALGRTEEALRHLRRAPAQEPFCSLLAGLEGDYLKS